MSAPPVDQPLRGIVGSSAANRIAFFPEPALRFRHGQALEDPRDGLSLFGPLEEESPLSIRVGVIGTPTGINYVADWLRRVQGPLTDQKPEKNRRNRVKPKDHDREAAEKAEWNVAHPPFPGFQSCFQIPVQSEPALRIAIPETELLTAVNVDDRHQRVHRTVGLYAERLAEASRHEETRPDYWFVVIPDIVYERCRPQANVPKDVQIKAQTKLNPRLARRLRREPSFFEEWNDAAEAYEYDVDFRNQLKARLLGSKTITQVVLESTVMPPSLDAPRYKDSRPFQAAIAWHLSTSAFYKAGGRPWKIDSVRKGVCYIGLVFKRDEREKDPRMACCAAQMFLDSGDGVVFRGAVGPWYADESKEFHLDRKSAKQLIDLALKSYAKYSPEPPKELFLHGRVSFDDEEWTGFSDAIDSTKTQLVGVKIRDDVALRLFRSGSHPVLRGTAYVRHDRSAYLWTRGFMPRMRTYVGREVPRPLSIDVDKGDAQIETVLGDIMALTKLNYNSCRLADGLPVTLRFANHVGEILTAGPTAPDNPLPFKHYI
jgi:hypothetical protein